MTRLQRLQQLWRGLFQRKPRPHAPPADPYAGRLVPVRRGPRPRGGAAVAEPEEDSLK